MKFPLKSPLVTRGSHEELRANFDEAFRQLIRLREPDVLTLCAYCTRHLTYCLNHPCDLRLGAVA